MRKSLLFCTIALSSLSVYASIDYPTAQWGSLFGGAAGDQSSAVAVSPTGDVLWLNTGATTADNAAIDYQNNEVFSNPANIINIALLCTDTDGNLKWDIHSTTGDFAANQGNVAVDKDGNIIFTAKVKHVDADHQVNLIDASGKEIAFGGTAENKYNRIIVVKSDPEGNISWVKVFEQSTAPAPMASGKNADFTPDAVSSTALTVDDSSNIYIGGNYCTDLTIDGVTLKPVNVSTWTGDSQTSCGNMFLIKLDADGNYLTSAIGEGDINGASSVQSLTWDDGKLYVYGSATGDNSFDFAGTTLTPTDIQCPIVGCLSADLKASWIKCLPSERVDGKAALQNVSVCVYGDNLWLSGQYNQKISDSADDALTVAATQGSIREGFIIKFGKADGKWLASADSRTDFPEITKITAYLKVFQNTTDMGKVYVYGYAMDANVGIFIREYDAEKLTANVESAWNIAKGGGVPTAITMAYETTTNALFITGRGNKEYTLMADPDITTEAPKSWDVLMAKYHMPDPTSDLAPATIYDDTIEIGVYDITGRYVGSYNKAKSLKALNLNPGIYVAGDKKILIRK